ncbi:MAG: argininosuccinate lyase [Thermodesulfobacteriota bacterium]
MSGKLWGGRFSEGTDRLVERFTSSIEVDRRLYAHDIRGSQAHAKMLGKCGIISQEDAAQIVDGLDKVRAEIEAGEMAWDDALEDIHMHVEARLTELIGPAARKLHTGRSRNDQIALDVRLFLRDETRELLADLTALRKALVTLSEEYLGAVLPGYTHMQRAQPVLLSHHLMAYYEMFTRDAERFADALKRINVLPLGAAALAGTPHPIDRAYVAELLDFPAVSANSMDTVADRDFAVEFMAAASLCMVHFSRLSEELILWSTSEFGFVEISDAFTTGSSIMPQKKNPDVCELVRGKTGRVVGDLVALLTLMKSLPMAYNRDMQEDKEPLFDAVGTLRATVAVYTRMLPNVRFRRERMAKATETGFLNATDLADYLVARDVPFREAHEIVGKAVAHATTAGCELHDLDLPTLQGFSGRVEADVYDALATETVVNRRSSIGGTATEQVRAAVAAARKSLDGGK